MTFSREERIKQIKDCGQSIIDDAEQIVGFYDYPLGLKVTITMDVNEVPRVKAEREFMPENIIERLQND